VTEQRTPGNAHKIQPIHGCTMLWVNEVTPGREQEYIEKVRDRVLPMYRKHGVDLLGCWHGGIGPKTNNVIFLINYHTFEQYNALYSDPEYIAMDSEMGFSSMRSNQAWFLNPVEISPVKD
jgi:hypothetical protein